MGPSESDENAAFVGLSFPAILDLIASKKPDRSWIITLEDGSLRHFKFGEVAQAVNNMAYWVEKSIGVSSCRETVAYMGVRDLRYPIMMLALMKTGYKVMLPSARNSTEAQLSLLRDTKCHKFMCSETVFPEVEALKASEPNLDIYRVPALHDILNEEELTGCYPDRSKVKKYEQLVILHTSGSTSLPKPIFLTYGALSTFMNLPKMTTPEGRRNLHDEVLLRDGCLFTMLPFFHSMGVNLMLQSLGFQGTLICMPPEKPVTADLIIQVLDLTEPRVGAFAPSMLEEIWKIPEGVQVLAKLEYVCYGGAPLSQDIGNQLIAVTNVIPLMGSTETGLMPTLVPASKEDWRWFEWAIESGIHMEQDGDGLYELVLKKGPEQYQPVFQNFPEIEEWRTNDLWERHPTRHTLWCYKGRKDDILVLANGEKLNPRDLEAEVEKHNAVRSALVVGRGRFQASLLIEPDWDKVESHQATILINNIWKAVQKANNTVPTHGRIWKSHIAIARPPKPFERTAKGSVRRNATIELYEEEINFLYSGESRAAEVEKLDPSADLGKIRVFLRSIFQDVLPIFHEDLSDDVDIFTLGADSLQVVELSRVLGQAIGAADGQTLAVDARTIYNNPTIESLSEAIYYRRASAGIVQSNSSVEALREKKISAMVDRYTHGLQPRRPSQRSVILTGSTGSLGNYLLDNLINSPTVSKVYCFNRSADAASRQTQSFKDCGKNPDFSKVIFLQVRLAETGFGTSEQMYLELLSTVDLIIHSAWMVDFNYPLERYEEHFKGIRQLVDFSRESRNSAHIFFISSIGSVGNWNFLREGEVPETTMTDSRVPMSQGYGESKHIAERILAIACQLLGVCSTIVRIGQIAGPRAENGGVWNPWEWVPTLINTSVAMEMIPEDLGDGDLIDWVPVDSAARILVELAETRMQAQGEKKMDVFHLRNPNVCTWKDLLPAIEEFYSSANKRQRLELVPMTTWVQKLKGTPLTKEKVAEKPAVKLLDLYEHMANRSSPSPRLAVLNTSEASESMKQLSKIDVTLMRTWLKQWKF